MNDPFLIEGPALIQFSGGRTSAYMLRRILDAHGGTLPPDVIACFQNTGKEREETLDFVQRCATAWGVHVVWLEYRPEGFEIVSHNSASRAGEPFEALIRKKQYLPNPVARFCTIELKIRVSRDFARSLGWDHWSHVLGLRADEPRRVTKAETNRERWENLMPLAEAGISKADVLAFWAAQPFDLQLRHGEGNCDICFLKNMGTAQEIMRHRPDLADWWIAQEALALASKPSGAVFRTDRPSYAKLLDAVKRQQVFDFGEEDQAIDCLCLEDAS